MEQFVHLDGTARFDLRQVREAPASEASDKPAVRRDVPVSAAFLEEGIRSCCVDLSSLWQPQPCCYSPSLPMTHSPAAAGAGALEVSMAAVPCAPAATAAARSQLGDTEAVLSRCGAGATAIAVAPIAAIATVSVRRQWARLRSAPLRRGPTTVAAAATTPMATGFARTTDRRDAAGLWVLEANGEVIDISFSDTGEEAMIRPAVVAFALCVVSSAQSMPYAPLQQPDNSVVPVRQGCGLGRQLVDGICVSNSKVRAAVRKCNARKMRMVNGRCEPRVRPAAASGAAQQPAATPATPR